MKWLTAHMPKCYNFWFWDKKDPMTQAYGTVIARNSHNAIEYLMSQKLTKGKFFAYSECSWLSHMMIMFLPKYLHTCNEWKPVNYTPVGKAKNASL